MGAGSSATAIGVTGLGRGADSSGTPKDSIKIHSLTCIGRKRHNSRRTVQSHMV